MSFFEEYFFIRLILGADRVSNLGSVELTNPLGPGINTFGEDKRIDELIRKYGYCTTPEVMEHVKENRDLMKNLSAAAHLIHGTSENRFRITYCPGFLTKEEIESVGYTYGNLDEYMKKYDVKVLKQGWNKIATTTTGNNNNNNGNDEEEMIYFIPNPALGLWAWKGRFE